MSKCLDQTEIRGNQHMRYANRKVFAFVYSFHLIPPPALPGVLAAILLSPDNLYIFSLKQRRQIPFKLQRALHSHPENTRGNISIPASHTESESTETNTLRPVLY